MTKETKAKYVISMLKELYVRVYRDEKRPSFQFYTGGIEQLYLLHIGKVQLNSIEIVNLYFTNQEYKIVNDYTTILNVNVPFDFFKFEEKESNFEKKHMILDALHWGLNKLAVDFHWSTLAFESSYKKCVENNLSYNWFFKGKLFKNAENKFYFGMWHLVDIGEYQIWEILFDKNKKEINRRLCFKDNVCVFFIVYASWEGQNEQFFYRFNGPKKKFVANVKDLVTNKPIQGLEDSNSIFKV